MPVREFKIGDKIKAVDPCLMSYQEYEALKVGKIYTVIDAGMRFFEVINERGEEHTFSQPSSRK
jgi:hypothetical protein